MRISDWSADVCSSDLIVREGKKIALLSLGTRLGEAEAAAAKLDAMGLSTTVADMRFAKPLDLDLVRKLAANHELLITIEEGAIGGFGAHVLTIASDEGRSEGHTSELQSLMRISYAVFCLKKNTKSKK